MNTPILETRVRILRPHEYELLISAAKTIDNQTRRDVLLLRGMRFVEAQRFQENPQ